jgi:hypothetical protein
MPKLFSLRTRNFCAKITDSRARECRQPVRPTALADPPALSSVHSNFKLKFGVKPPIQRRIDTMLSFSSVILWEIFDKSQIRLICLHTTFSRLQTVHTCEIARAESFASNCDLCVESALRTNARTLLGVKDGALAE